MLSGADAKIACCAGRECQNIYSIRRCAHWRLWMYDCDCLGVRASACSANASALDAAGPASRSGFMHMHHASGIVPSLLERHGENEWAFAGNRNAPASVEEY